MRFVMYTDKTVPQCLSAINERLHAKETGSRPGMDGWTDKKGSFSMAMSSKVAGRFNRKTRLEAKAERETGITVIKGYVSGGVERQEQAIIVGAVVLVALLLLSGGNALLAIIAVLAGALLFIPLSGDYNNSAVLLKELRLLLKARETPPTKKPTQIRSAAPKPTASASARPKSAAVSKTPLGANLSAKKPTMSKPAASKPTLNRPS